MAIEPFEGYKMVCDECDSGEGFECDGYEPILPTEDEARGAVELYDGRMDGDRVICGPCVERLDDEAAASGGGGERG